MATSPPISPTVATPLAHRKRRHSAIERNDSGPACDGDDIDDLDALPSPTRLSNGGAEKLMPSDSSATATVMRKLEDDDDDVDEDDKEALDDVLDTAELEPYRPGMCYLIIGKATTNQML